MALAGPTSAISNRSLGCRWYNWSCVTAPRSPMQSLRLNPILNTDSYKLTHWWQYPPDTRHIYSYLESRGGMFEETMLAMLQYIIKSNFAGQVFTLDDVAEA